MFSHENIFRLHHVSVEIKLQKEEFFFSFLNEKVEMMNFPTFLFLFQTNLLLYILFHYNK